MSNFEQAVNEGLKTSATASAIVGATGAAVGALVGASMGPFAVVAAPVGAAIGFLVGFFMGLAKHVPSPEEVKKAQEAQAKAKAQAANINAMMNDPDYQSLFVNMRDAIVKVVPMLGNAPVGGFLQYIHDVKADANASPQVKAGAQAFMLLKVISSLQKPADNPMDYFTDPTLKALVGPALKQVGIDVNNPNVLKVMQANYATPVPTGTIPIHRKSDTARMNAQNAAQGLPGGNTRYIVDSRAFNPKIAPYGVISFALAPVSAQPGSDLAGSPNYGVPLRSAWPWGLDADNFAKPPPANVEALANATTAPWTTEKKIAAAAGAACLGYLAYAFLL